MSHEISTFFIAALIHSVKQDAFYDLKFTHDQGMCISALRRISLLEGRTDTHGRAEPIEVAVR